MKKILVVLDASEIGQATQQYAIDLAKQFSTPLTGLAILDTPWITASQPEPLGGASFKMVRDDVLIEKSHAHLKEQMDLFKNRCAREKVNSIVLEASGFPETEIERLSYEHDLIVIGRTTDFHFELDDDSDLTVKHVVRDNPRPIITIPGKSSLGNKVLVAYDGSLQTARALHMFLLLGLGIDKELSILTISPTKEQAEEIGKKAKSISELYGAQVRLISVASDEKPEEIILKESQNNDYSLIVMGAFHKTIITEALFGSCTRNIMKRSNLPLFIHH
ncbi:universal stress protein [Candidatus Nucleicultrix amoebiphila]|uniref:UspA domain-containing protein n=1 Tax=Candidatus Nucleicultrix amoebiphila FS5 TaxID=1414854 RepID=A0A1W6N2L8_9PROT|nr:universal stress protein [Candidatus Nucleicultrix amoebiphila]ARN84016.1 hypothetical protein GQ61_00100 [Candidatus Nucleicultrix amoebiphila FS5]